MGICGCVCIRPVQAEKSSKIAFFLPFFDIKHALLWVFVRVRTMYKRACVMSIAARIKQSQIRQVDEKPTDTDKQPMSQSTA